MQSRSALGVLLLVLALTMPTVGSASELREVVVRDVTVIGDDLRGELVNQTGEEIRDVRLLIRRPWLWAREFAPGPDSPGRAAYKTIRGPIPPWGRLEFVVYPIEPLPERNDGHFAVSIEVVGFTAVGG